MTAFGHNFFPVIEFYITNVSRNRKQGTAGNIKVTDDDISIFFICRHVLIILTLCMNRVGFGFAMVGLASIKWLLHTRMLELTSLQNFSPL